MFAVIIMDLARARRVGDMVPERERRSACERWGAEPVWHDSCFPFRGTSAAHRHASCSLRRGGSTVNLSNLWAVLKAAGMQWLGDKAPRLGAALAYYAIFSIAPLLTITIGIAGLVFGREAAQGQ